MKDANATRAGAGQLTYLIGDATAPAARGDEMMIIAHSCNDSGGWGAGFVMALDARWRRPGDVYVQWCNNWRQKKGPYKDVPFELGFVMMVPVEENITVANIIGQGFNHKGMAKGGPPVSYDALRTGFRSIVLYIKQTPGYENATVHMPRIGAVLGGGNWATIEKIIKEEFCDQGVDAFVYDLPADSKNAGRIDWGVNRFDPNYVPTKKAYTAKTGSKGKNAPLNGFNNLWNKS